FNTLRAGAYNGGRGLEPYLPPAPRNQGRTTGFDQASTVAPGAGFNRCRRTGTVYGVSGYMRPEPPRFAIAPWKCYNSAYAPVAQRTARGSPKAEVGGSTPSWGAS